LRNYLKRENGNTKEGGTEIDGHHTSKNGRYADELKHTKG